MAVEFEPNLFYCLVLAAFGGVMEVVATAVLAYPAAQMIQGIEWSERGIKFTLTLNLFFQIIASIAGNLCSTWFGPISIAGPVFFASQLVANLIIFWLVLGLESFTKEMQVGTYVIVVAVTLLLRVGPGEPGMQDFEELITKPWAFAWSIMLMTGMLLTTIPLIPNFIDMCRLSVGKRFFILLTVRATAFSINLTTGRAVILEASKSWILTSIVIKVISGAIYTRAIVVQSTSVEQAKFVPLNAVVTLLTVAITGIIIWEDHAYVKDWVGYVCVFLLFGLGCFLLLGDFQLLSEKDPKAFRATYELTRAEGRRGRIEHLKAYGSKVKPSNVPTTGYDLESGCNDSSVTSVDQNNNTPPCEKAPSLESTTRVIGNLRRKSSMEAWKSLYDYEQVDMCCELDSQSFDRSSIFSLKPNHKSFKSSGSFRKIVKGNRTDCTEREKADPSCQPPQLLEYKSHPLPPE